MSENCNYAPVEKVILIDDRRIEIYWGEQMRRADNENDYLVQRGSTGTGTLDQ